jgi:hypothetical protein
MWLSGNDSGFFLPQQTLAGKIGLSRTLRDKLNNKANIKNKSKVRSQCSKIGI